MKIYGEFLSNLRFAVDIILCTETPQELQQMIHQLPDESRRMGLNNIAKTKVMVAANTPINVNNMLLQNVQGYVYLCPHYGLKEKTRTKRQCRIKVARGPWHILSAGPLRSGLATFTTSTGARETVGAKQN